MSRSALSGSWTTLSSESFASSSWKTKVRFSLSSTAVSHAVSSAMEITKCDGYVTFYYVIICDSLKTDPSKPIVEYSLRCLAWFWPIYSIGIVWNYFLRLGQAQTKIRILSQFIITGTECCRPKRRNIYSPRSMNLKTKELKRRQPKDESEIWLTPMRYHRSDVTIIHMTSSSVPERIFFFRDHSIT